MNKFLKDLENALKKLNVSTNEINEIIADHEEMLNQALAEGLSEEELSEKFGDPKKLAQDLSVDAKKEKGGNKMYELVESLAVLDELISVEVKLVSEDVEILPSESGAIEIYYKDVEKPEDYEYSLEGGAFLFKRKSEVGIKIFRRRNKGKIRILLPETALESYNVKIVSGDVVSENVKTKRFVMHSTSGDGSLKNIDTELVEIHTVSGDFELDHFTATLFKANSVSGDFEINNLKVQENLDLNTVSGDFKVKDVEGTIVDLKTVSGDFDGKEVYVEKVNLNSVSGDIKIRNEDSLRPIEIGRKKSLSGKISIK